MMLNKNSLHKIDKELTKYPVSENRSAIMAALRIAQEEHGWLSTELIAYVAEYIKIPPVQALEVATFYNMYNLKPTGKYKLMVCTNLPCALSGGVDAAQYIKQKLGIEFGETTKDGKFTLLESECMGACGYAPVLTVNNHKMCAHMDRAAIDKKLAELE
jgi:NADH-quinone oxidoreductase subunit E